MADVKKKVDLNFNSNVDKILKSLKDLQKSINALQKATEKLNDLNKSQAEASQKAIEKNTIAVKKLNKEKTEGSKLYTSKLQRELDKQKEIIKLNNERKKSELSTNKELEKFKKISAGVDVLGGIRHNLFVSDAGADISRLATVPSAILDMMPSGVNKISENVTKKNTLFAQEKNADISNKQAEIDEIDKQLKKLNSKSKLTKKQAAYKEKLEKDKETLKGEQSGLLKEIKVNDLKTGAINTGLKTFSKLISLSLQPLKAMTDAISSSVKELLSFNTGLATMNMSTSLITNATARENQMKYGLSANQYVGVSKAADLLNIKSEEDYMYMNAEQRELFRDYTTKFSNMYAKLESSGVLQNIQEMQLDLKVFQQEMAMEFLSWIAKNKDSIMTLMRGIMEATMKIVEFIMSIANFLMGSSLSTSADAKASSARVVNVTVNSNATISNNGQSVSTGVVDDIASGIKEAALTYF